MAHCLQKSKSYIQVSLRIAFKCQHPPTYEKEVSNEANSLFANSACFEDKFRLFKSYLLDNAGSSFDEVDRVI